MSATRKDIPDQKTPKKKLSIIWRILRFVFIFLIITVLIFVLALFSLDQYLQSNKTKLFAQLSFLNNGSISFDEADISVYKNFPAATLVLKNVQVKDSLFPQHQLPLLHVDELRANLSLQQLWEKEAKLKSIELRDGRLNLHTDSSGYSLLKGVLPKVKNKTPSDEKSNWLRDWLSDFKLDTERIKFSLSNVYIRFTNDRKHSSIQGNADKLEVMVQLTDSVIIADIDMAIALKEMAFNIRKGAFLPNSYLSGKPQVRFSAGVLSFQPFDLQINEELFIFQGIYDTKKTTVSELILENKKTRFAKIFPLLPAPIQRHVTPYKIKAPFYSKTSIKSYFRRGDAPIVDISFVMEKNQLQVFHIPLHDVDLKGRFVNRIFEGPRAFREGKKRVRLEVHQLSAYHAGFHIQSNNALITSTPQTGPMLGSKVKVKGKAEAISKWLASDQFFFDKGNFELNAQVQGPINNFDQILIESDATLKLNDIDVQYYPADVAFPFKQLTLQKRSGDADFKLISSTPRKGHNFQIDGLLQNLPALILDIKDQQVKSEADFVAERISWRDFMDWFGKNSNLNKEKKKTEEEKKKTMKQTISGIQDRFQPRLSLSIDTLSYYDLLQFHNLTTKVYFEGNDFLVLEKTSFEYEQGRVDFSARLDISQANQTPFEFELRTQNLNLKKLLPPLDYFNIQLLANLDRHPEDLNLTIKHQGIIDDQKGLIPNTSSGEISFDIEGGEFLAGKISYKPDPNLTKDSVNNKSFTKAVIQLQGDPNVFNDFLKTEQFFFDQGRFFLYFDYENDPANFEEILTGGTATLKIRDSYVLYKPAEITFPLTKIDLVLQSDVADFDLFLQSDSLQQEIELSGVINNLSELVIGNTGKSISTIVDIKSPKLIWNQFLYLFSSEEEPQQEKSLQALRTTIKGMFSTFDPNLSIQTDTFVYTDKFFVENFQTGAFMDDADHLFLEKTAFDFHDGSVSVKGKFDLSQKEEVPFNAAFGSKDLDVVKLLESLDYVALPSLRSIEKLAGRITMDFDINGVIALDGRGLIPATTDGLLDVILKGVVLQGMAPLDEMAAKIKMKKRFANLRFAPIENKITIEGREIEIPLMEIQSNAFNLFLEGTLSYDDKTNIWITIPLDNLQNRDLGIIPVRRGYAAAKHKVYLEVTSDEEGNNKFKFRISKRKFYKKRGILSQFREDKRRYRKERKEMRRNRRY